jgi:hypothetical protein
LHEKCSYDHVSIHVHFGGKSDNSKLVHHACQIPCKNYPLADFKWIQAFAWENSRGAWPYKLIIHFLHFIPYFTNFN